MGDTSEGRSQKLHRGGSALVASLHGKAETAPERLGHEVHRVL